MKRYKYKIKKDKLTKDEDNQWYKPLIVFADNKVQARRKIIKLHDFKYNIPAMKIRRVWK